MDIRVALTIANHRVGVLNFRSFNSLDFEGLTFLIIDHTSKGGIAAVGRPILYTRRIHVAGLMRGAIFMSILCSDVLRIPIPLIVVFNFLFNGSAVGAFILGGFVSWLSFLFTALCRRVFFTVVVAGACRVGLQRFRFGLRQAGGGNKAVGETVGIVE